MGGDTGKYGKECNDKKGRLRRLMGKIAATYREGGATNWENEGKGGIRARLSGVENGGENGKLRQIWEKIRG